MNELLRTLVLLSLALLSNAQGVQETSNDSDQVKPWIRKWSEEDDGGLELLKPLVYGELQSMRDKLDSAAEPQPNLLQSVLHLPQFSVILCVSASLW